MMSKYQHCKNKCSSCQNKTVDNVNMLTFALKKQWFEKIESGEKTIEFRECKKFWNSRLLPEGAELEQIDDGYSVVGAPTKCVLTLGYTQNKLFADIEKVEVWTEKQNDLGINPVFAIYLKNVRRNE